MLGAGGLFASAADVARFLSFHLGDGILDGKRLIAESLLAEMYRVQYRVESQVCGYGLGLLIDQRFGATLLTHSGGGYGYQAVQSWIPEYDQGVVVLVNRGGDLHTQVHAAAFRAMIAAKYGAVPDDPPLPYLNWPVVPVPADELSRLAGAYRGTGGPVTVREQAGALYLDGTQPLLPYSPTEFTSPNGARVTFRLDTRGRPVELRILDHWGYNRFPIDHTPVDEPGPDKPEWHALTGIYRVSSSSIIEYIAVTVKNGRVCATGAMGEAHLSEYRPGLFFTADGEAILFLGEGLTYGNAYCARLPADYCRALEQAPDDPGDRRLTEGALIRLGEAYLALQATEEAARVLRLNVHLHPQSPEAQAALARV